MTEQTPQFGNLTPGHLRQLVSILPELDHLLAEMRQVFAEKREKLDSILTPGFSWAHYYELPIDEHMGHATKLLGLATNGHCCCRHP